MQITKARVANDMRFSPITSLPRVNTEVFIGQSEEKHPECKYTKKGCSKTLKVVAKGGTNIVLNFIHGRVSGNNFVV